MHEAEYGTFTISKHKIPQRGVAFIWQVHPIDPWQSGLLQVNLRDRTQILPDRDEFDPKKIREFVNLVLSKVDFHEE